MTRYSLSLFFNEWDLLRLKISEECPHVDRMIIADSTITQQGNRKPADLWERRAEFPEIEVVLYDPDKDYGRQTIEYDQRQEVLKGINIKPDDRLFITDIDEIIDARDFEMIDVILGVSGFCKFIHSTYHYKINLYFQDGYMRPGAVVGNVFNERFHGVVRQMRRDKQSCRHLRTRMKHFSFLGGVKNVEAKLRAYGHLEFNTEHNTDPLVIDARISGLLDPMGHGNVLIPVPVDDSYPETITRNLDQWQKFIYKPEVFANA